MMKSLSIILVLLYATETFAQEKGLREEIYDRSDCTTVLDTIWLPVDEKEKEFKVDDSYFITAFYDEKVKYFQIRDSTNQELKSIVWVPLPYPEVYDSFDSLLNIADRIDTTEYGVELYVGPLQHPGTLFETFIWPVSGAKKDKDGNVYRHFATCEQSGGVTTCSLHECNTTCDSTDPPYDSILRGCLGHTTYGK